ncbi:N-acetyl-D-glucosamine kinase [bacterium HR34]|nr:N-acetyl-D-glucosamine kinase [bacterium HR34]
MYFSCDVGATKTRIGFSRDCKKIENIIIKNTPKNFNDGVNNIVGSILDILAHQKTKKIRGVILGVPGLLDKEKIKIKKAPNLPLWQNKPIKKYLENKLRTKVFLENDTALVGLGEAVYGAGKGYKVVSYLTISTGVNGVKIENGKIDENVFGFELGHQVLAIEKNKPVYIERLIGGRWLKEKYKKEPYNIKDKKVWQEVEKNVAILVNNAIVHWSPECVILGGSITKSLNINNVRNIVKEICIFPRLPYILKSKFSDVAGIYGGLYFLYKNDRCSL